jgi:hypothetical protein
VHAMLLSGAHSKTDAFLSWAWDLLRPGSRRDRRSLLEATSHRLGRGRTRRTTHLTGPARSDYRQPGNRLRFSGSRTPRTPRTATAMLTATSTRDPEHAKTAGAVAGVAS